MRKHAVLAAACLIVLFGNAAIVRAAEERRLTMQGLGPVKFGMTVAQAEKALGRKLTSMDNADGISTEACWLTQNADGAQPWITYMVQNGQIVRIDVWDKPNAAAAVSSDKGIRIGSAQQSVVAAYPTAEAALHPHLGIQGRYIRILSDDKAYGLLFEMAAGTVVNFRAGKREAIELSETCL